MQLLLLTGFFVIIFGSSVITFQTVSAVGTADVYLECPEKWKRNEEVKLSCRINAAHFTESVCTGQLTDVADFMFKSRQGGYATSMCHVSNFKSSCLKDSSRCGCQSLSGGVYELYFNLKVVTEYAGSSWKCDIVCLDNDFNSQLTYDASVGCSTVTVVNATSVPAPADKQTNAGLIAGAVFGGLAGVAVVCVALYFLIRRKRSQKQRGSISRQPAPISNTLEANSYTDEAESDTREAQSDTVGAQSNNVEAKSDSLEAKSDPLEAQSDPLEAQLDYLEPKLDTVEAKLDTVETKSKTVEAITNGHYYYDEEDQTSLETAACQ